MDPMIESANVPSEPVLTGHRVVDAVGEKIGVIDDVLFDAETNVPTWAIVNRGILRSKASVVPLKSCRTMDKAVVTAARLARRGDVVLLSPACASFDQYSNYEERGEHFIRLVKRLKG